MKAAVVDASVLVNWFGTRDTRRDRIRQRFAAGDAFFAPAHLDVEVASGLRGLALRDAAVARRASAAFTALAVLAVQRVPVGPLLDRIWQLRANVTPYDAAYVALAEMLDAPLITCDSRLATASGPTCPIELIG